METIELKDKISIQQSKAFEIISNIEEYPDFVPGYKDVKILEKNEKYILAEITPTIPIKKIIMKAELNFPEKITFYQIKGPLDVFKGEWEIKKIDDNSCLVKLKLNYYVKNFIKRKLIYGFINMIFKDIITAFKIRANRE